MDFAKYYDRNTFRDLLTENKCKPRIGLDTSCKKRRRFRQRKQTIIIGPRGFRGFKGKDGSGQPEPVIGNPPTIVLIGNSIIEHDVNTAWNEPGVIATSSNGNLIPFQNPTLTGVGITITGSPPIIPNNIDITYTIVYTAYDGANGTAQISRNVIIVDKLSPTITLLGPNPFYYEVYSETEIPGVTITDNYSTGLTAVLSGDTVDKNTDIGTYTIIYSTQDSSGNQATSVERTVIVRDTTPPVINLIDDSSIIVEAGDGYQDPGITFSDNYSQPENIVIDTSLIITDTTVPGNYSISYIATDEHLNSSNITRNVEVKDTTPPKMYLKYYITLSNSELLINCIPNLENINYNNENNWTNFVLKNDKNYYFNSIYNLEFYKNSNYSEASKIQTSNILNDYVLEVDENYVADFGEWIYYKLLDNTNEILGKFKVVSDNNIPDVLVEIGTSYKEGSFSGNDDVISIDSFLGDITNNITQTQQQIPNPQVLGIYKSIWNSNDGYNSETIDKTVRVIDTIPPEIYIQFKVTVSSIATSNTRNNINKFLFDGLKPWENDNIVLKNGLTYYFDQSDISNSSHPLLFSYDGSENGQGTVVSTRNGVPGTPGAWTKLEVANNQTSIYYYCLNHYLMGDVISIVNDINHYDRTLELGTNYLDTDPFTFDNSLITPTLNKTINIPLANLQILDEINTIEYIAEDTSLNTSNLTKRIKIIDTTPPVIELVGGTDITVSESTSVYNWIEPIDQNGIQGWIAYDPRQDADDIILTPYVTREGNGEAGGYQVNLNDGDGNLEITYTVFDKQDQNNEWTEGNKFEITRNVNIIKLDNDSPTIVLNFAPIKYDIGANPAEQFIETGFTIFDDLSQPENITITIENFEIQQPSHFEQPSFGTLIGDFDGTQSLGLYKRVYTAIDESNNTVQAFRLIELVDETPPTITLNTADNKYDIGADPSELFIETGFQVNDHYWQPENITVTIENFSITEPSHFNQPQFGQPITNIADDTLALGFYKVVYTATDDSNNTSQEFRLIEYVDETPPVITFEPELQPAVYDVGVENPDNFVIGDTDFIDLFQATDKYHNQPDGVTKNIIITLDGQVVNTIDENTDVGNYKIYFTATDNSGNVNNQPIHNVDILVYDNTAPVVPDVQPETISISNILQNGIVNWVDTEYEKILTETVDYYDDRKPNRNINYQTNYSDLDFTTIGIKTMNYTITDSNGNSVTKTRDVTVVDIIAPIIILNPTQEKYNLGANPAELFIETGYTVTDNYSPQEDITVDINYFSLGNNPNNNNQPEWTPITNILDETLPLGFYKIVYTAKDSSNNSTQAFRLIEYVDETEPIIILLGDITNKYDIGADPAELFVEPGYQINDHYWQPENVTVTIENFSITEPSHYNQPQFGQPITNIADETLDLGFYKVVYTATDDSNNTTQEYRLIEYVDETPPVITFEPELQPAVYDVGVENPVNFVIGDTDFIDLFQATDKYHNQPDGVTKNVITTLNGQVVNAIDENTDVGNYKIYFTATDNSGNVNNQPIHNVDILVYDNTAPVVPDVQPETISISDIIQNGGVFFDTEFENIKSNTIDYYDDRKSNRSIIYQTNYSVLDFTTIGTKTMNYIITDSNGNSVTKTRDVTVVDVSDPIIVLNPTQEKYNLGANPAELFIETGYTVTDNYSPQEDITVDIKYFSIGNDPNNNNQPEWTPITNILDETLPLEFYKIVYTAKDSSNNTSQAFRLIEYVDETAPVITLTPAPLKYNLGATPPDEFVDPGYQVIDYYWQPENITITIENYSIDFMSEVNQPSQGSLVGELQPSSSLGLYKVVYTATDASNNTSQAFRAIEFVDETPPEITLQPELQPAIYDVGVENPIDFSTLFSDTFENLYSVDDRYGPVTKNVTINLGNQVISQIDENSDVGNYEIILSATDSNNNEASKSINVNVFDNTPPIITLFMQPEIVELSDIQENGGYIDNFSQPENILVTDYYDDRKSNRTTILTSNINQSDFTLGNTVTITYTAIDSNGNQSTDSRDITVVDTISPNITLIGEPEMTVGISDLLYNYDIIPGITVSDDVTAPENILIITEYYKTDDNKQPEILLGSDIETINDVGTYLIRYKARDLGYPVYNENIKTRCVNVIYDFPRFPDLGQAPTITLIGDSNITIGISEFLYSQNSDIVDPGFIVTDPDTDSSNVTSTTEYFRVDSDNVSLVELQDVSEINDIGNYKIKYSAQDNYKNKTTVERTVSIVYDFPRFPIENQQQTSNIKLNTNTESQVIDKNITIKKKSRSIKPIKKYKIETNNTQNNKSPVKFKTSNNKKRYSLKKHTRVTQDIELNDYYHDKIVMVDNNLIRTSDLFERFQYGNYKSFMIKNNTKKVIYITNMEFFMFVSDKNLRCSFYYIEKNPTNMKKNLKKDTWKEIRLHVRLQTFGKKCIEEGGSEINVPLTELEIQPKQTYYIIMELDSPGWIDILANSSGKHYDYKNKWITIYKQFHHKIMGYTLGDLKSDSPSSSPDNKSGIRSLNFGYLRNFKFTVNQSKYYYFIIKSKEPCYVHINEEELIVSKKCPKGSRGSKKLQTGEVYTMSLYFTKDEPSNYFGWSKVYGKNWISDFKDNSSITFL